MKNIPFVLLTCAVLLSGCVQTRMYVAEKPRVDQDVPGIPPPGTPKTRQIIVLEVIEKDKGGFASKPAVAGVKQGAGTGESKVVAGDKDTTVVHEGNFTFPGKTSDMLTRGASVGIPSEYKVEKDDTLQKISRKVYGSFSKWTRIYDANKEVIKDPNFLKPGTLLKIPAEQ